MAKPLRCWLHRHHWQTLKNADGDAYDSCTRCGFDRAVDPGNPWASDSNVVTSWSQVVHTRGHMDSDNPDD
jgi:hypothetical protein